MVACHVQVAGGLTAVCTSGMHRNAPVVAEYRHHMSVAVYLDFPADELVRHRMPVPVELYVAVESDFGGFRPDMVVRQQRKRPKRRPFPGLEHFLARAATIRKRPRIELIEQPADLGVELRKRFEFAVPNHRNDPPGHLLNRIPSDRLVAGLSRTRRNDRHIVVIGPSRLVRVDHRIVAVVTDHRRLQVVGHHHLRRTTEILEHPRRTGDPVADLLRPARLGIDIVRHPEGADKDLRLASGNRHRRPGIVNKHRLAELAAHPHGAAGAPLPLLTATAEPRVTVRIALVAKLLPQQLQGHALAFHLARHPLEIKLCIGLGLPTAIQQLLQPILIDSVRQRPADAGVFRSHRQPMRRSPADVQRRTDALARPPALGPQPENLGNLFHLRPPSGHGRHLLQSRLPNKALNSSRNRRPVQYRAEKDHRRDTRAPHPASIRTRPHNCRFTVPYMDSPFIARLKQRLMAKIRVAAIFPASR